MKPNGRLIERPIVSSLPLFTVEIFGLRILRVDR